MSFYFRTLTYIFVHKDEYIALKTELTPKKN